MFEGAQNIRIIRSENSSENKAYLRDRLLQLSTTTDFFDDKWVCDKMRKSSAHTLTNYTIYFSDTPDAYKETLKYYVLIRLGRSTVRTLSASLSYYKSFFRYLVTCCDSKPLAKINREDVKNFELYIIGLNLSKSTKEMMWGNSKLFFAIMAGWDGIPYKNPFGKSNPFKRTSKDRNNPNKYIPEFIANQLDKIFQDITIPVCIRLCYWVLRAIPSRIEEVLAMSLEDCLKPSYDNKVTLYIPTWKQNGGHVQPELRAIYLEPKGDFEKFLIGLIKEQQENARRIQDKVNQKGFLFTYESSRYSVGASAFLLLIDSTTRDIFDKISEEFGVKDEKGKLYLFDPHQLRHNGITDRIDAGFSFIEIRDMTNHKGNGMIWNAYYHPRKEITLRKQMEIMKESKSISVEKPVYFRGRFLNLDQATVERILRNPRAYRIMDGTKNIGICSNITGCRSGLFECLDCHYFSPNVDDLDYFIMQIEVWKNKVKMFAGKKQALENAKNNLHLHRRIVERIEVIMQQNALEGGI